MSDLRDLDAFDDEPLEEVAVVGMAGRFPGAPDLETFWRNLREGVESISRFPDEELLAAGTDPALLADPRYVRARGVVEGADLFDAPFFGLSPREAAITDPQQRVFLECALEALENAGIDPETHAGRIAVYAGQTFSTYLVVNLLSHGPSPDESWQMVLANDKDTLATRVSYKLNLRGPSLSVGTACSTSLVTVHMARQALLDYECDVALAGGVAIRSPQATGYLFQEEGILSPDGHCRPFDARGRGTVFSSGAGIVVLKRLSDALKDGDTVRAVLKGSALNNDGSNKIGFTAPSADGQAEVIARALALAGVDPETVGYVETHGTATPLGDPIEIAGLTRAFRAAGASRRGFCALGSVKSNIGHTDSAAGVAGLIKTVLALENREIPPSLWIERPNPQIDFAASPFFVNDRLRPWENGDGPRRAGVSSFGIGGTNAHVVVEEAPELPETSPAARPWQLLVLSAKTRSALESATARLAAHLKAEAEEEGGSPSPERGRGGTGSTLADIAFTLQTGRRALPWRRAVVCRDRDDAVEALSGRGRLLDGTPPEGSATVAFLFPGQGSQRVGMGRELYLTEPLFRREVDHMAAILRPHLEGEDIRELLEAAKRLDRTSITQPALFVIETALARLWMSWGLKPQALLGHSVGEYVAAHLSGTLSLEDALALVAARGRLVEELPGGAMLAVPLAEEEVVPLLGAELSLAAVNGPAQCVVSGPEEAVEALRSGLAARGTEGRRLATSHAFHSRQMEPVLEAFTKLVRAVSLKAPEIPWISNVTGRWITAEEATDPLYWARHLRQTVRFGDGLEALLSEPGRVLLEVGPGRTLTRLARRRDGGRVAVPSLLSEEGRTEPAHVLAALGTLWAAGLAVDWKAFHGEERRRRVPLPTYPFERRRHWIEPARTLSGTGIVSVEEAAYEEGLPAGAVAAEDLAHSDDPAVASIARVWKEVLGVGRVAPGDRFFDLGGDSLIALRVVARLRQELSVELPVRALFERATVPALREAVAEALASAEPPIPRRSGTEPAPLSFLQQQLWFLDQLEPGNPAYVLASQMRISGRLDVPLFAGAVREAARRHETLRTVFRSGSDGPVQVVLPEMEIPVLRVDLTALPAERREPEWRRRAGEAADRPFDLSRGPLLRMALAQVDRDQALLLLTVHHAIADGWSQGLLVRELVALYDGSPLPEPPLQFADFAVWQRRQTEAVESDLAYWRRQLADPPAALELPADRPRPAVQSFRGSSVPAAVPAPATQALAELARSEEATPFMAFLAGFLVLLARHSGQPDLLVGTPVAGRGRKELEGVFGLFVNTLVLRGDLAGDPGFRELLRRVRRTSLEVFAHQFAPLERILEAVRPDRDLARNPLFQAMFLFQNLPPVPEVSAAGLTLRAEEMESRASMFDVALSLTERDGGVSGFLQYSSDLFDRTTVHRLAARYRLLLEAAAEAPDLPVSELPLMPAAERHQVLLEHNDTAAAWTADRCVHELIADQAARTPDALAAGRMTYRELDRRAGRLARRLVRQGVGPDVLVGVAAERSPELLVMLLGVLKAGGAYVPLDPTHPRERLDSIADDAGVRILLTGLDDDGEEIDVPLPAADPENLAYVIYTSGSTGRPKGVEVRHRGVVNYLASMARRPGLDSGDVIAAVTTISFDIAVTELLLPLTVGARIEIVDRETAGDPALLAAALDGVTCLQATPATWTMLLEGGWAGKPGLKALCGGEALPRALADRLLPRVGELWNVYGPTETTVWSAALRVEPGERPVPVGRPLANTALYSAPFGVAGELLIGGDGLARGYHGRPDLTAERFVPDPSGPPGSRLYRTGDLARRLPDGTLEFLGRVDFQVKVRGFRIELGEIEAVLASHPAVRECVVAARQDEGDTRLVAYVVGEASGLRGHLAGKLPAYMVPAAFVALPALPLTPSGKVDRRALPAPGRARDEEGFAAPSDPLEELLAGIWAEVLRLDRVGLHDSFFELGGHSLMATRVRSRIRELLGADLPLRKLFEAPTVARLAQEVRAARDGGAAPDRPLVRLPPEAREGELPLSFAQQRLWLLDQIEPESAAYNLPAAMRLTGELSVGVLERVFAEIVRRHESLRTTFPSQGGRPVQRIAPELRPEIRRVDVAGEEEARELALEEARRPFDLRRGPLLRLALGRLGERDWLLVVTLHHIVADGWSWGVLLREIGVLYEAFSQGLPSPLPEPPVQYADFAVWQREALEGEVLERQLAWWKRRLAGTPAALELPTDRPRPALPTHRGGVRRLTLPPDLLEGVIGVCRHHGATPFMALLAAWAVLLGRHAGQEQVLIGTPVAGRNRREVEGLIGFFANTLVMRVDLAGDPGFGELLGRVRESALDAFTHQDLPFERLVDEVAPDRDLRRPPVFQVLFILQNAPLDSVELPGLTLRQLPVDVGAAKFDLTLNLTDTGGSLEYDADLFDATTAERHLGHYVRLLRGIVAEPDLPFRDLPLMPEAERHQVLVEHNDAAAVYPADLCVHELIAAQAARTPEAPAAGRMTYRELDRRAARLARRLVRQGVGPEVLVGVAAERSPELLVTLLGVLKAGGAYVPLDPTHPRERLDFILEDAGVRILLTGLEEDGEDADVPLPAVDPENLAYVIYTSGSTGRPKGVEVCHRGVVNYLASMARRPGLGSGDAIAAVTTISFDIAVTELLLPLAVGARIEMVDRETAGDPALLAAALEGVACLQATPATWTMLLEGGWAGKPGLKALCGGEALPRALADRLLPRVGELWNVYGPTETTVWSAALRVSPGERQVPVGRPLGNTALHLLARDGLAPLGVAGELLIGGDGLARGYHDRPDLTAERFVPDPFGPPGSRLYRTGDLARRLPDGTLEFLGRIDFQVKVRGFRIELGEIEAVLAGHPAVRECVVVARQDEGETTLVAYVVGEASELRGFLAGKLPPYMVPAAFVALPALPLTPSGKVDRKALPAPERTRDEKGFTAPSDPLEELIAGVWAGVLRLDRVGVHDNFFELGGHSLLGAQVISRLRDVLGVELPLRKLFEAPTVAGLAAAARAARGDAAAHATVPEHLGEGDLPLSFGQQRLWLLDQIEPGSAAYNLPAAVRMSGEVSAELLERVFAEIVRRHEALRTTFPSQGGRPVQRILPELRPPIRVIEVAGEEEARERALGEVRQPFDLQRGPLLRLALLRFRGGGERESLLVMTLHHIVADGWSWGVLLREIGVLYQAFSEGRPSPLPELPVQYADFAVWQRGWLEGEVLEGQLAWWKDRLAGAPAALELPTDRPRPSLPTHRGGLRPVALSPALLEGVNALGRRHGATPFMALLAAWAVLLGRHAGQDDVLIGTPVAGRNRRELENLIGFFVNTLVLRIRLSGSFGALLERVRETALDAFAHQDLPFERLVDEVAPDRDLRRPPVFQVLFILQNAPLGALELPGLLLRQIPVDAGLAKFDLTLSLADTSGHLEYDAELFDATTAERFVLHYERLLQSALAAPDVPLADLPLMPETERHQVLVEHNDAAAAYPAERCVHELIADQAARTPEALAAGRMTYGELDRRATRLARRLVRQGVGPDVLVGVAADRSPELLATLLGVLKAGGAYVPLDPAHPRERLDFILQDAGVRILLAGLDEDGEDADVPLPAVDPENLAYVIYTSGSTGRPKGVEVRHRGVVNYLASMARLPGLDAGDVMMAVTTVSFDIAVTELLLPLTVGARVEIVDRETAGDPARLAAALEGVTCLQATPATWTMLLEGGWAGKPGLKALCGGEALPRALADRLLPRVGELWNVYGPTETTVWSAALRVEPGEGPVPVGRPLANTTLHVQAPLGVAGELLIGGDGLARGYHGRPDLTAERFVPDPFGPPGSRLYRTGDLARRLPDGTLELLGRLDFQVKVRGFRIELGEIEAVLASHPAVRECVVAARQDEGATTLVAYVVGEVSELRGFLAGKLPPYMVPAAFVALPALPLTPSGKVDRRALPAPERARHEPAGFVPPSDPMEGLIAGIWAEVLRLDRVGVHDSFFELGGHSLLGAQVVSRLRETLGVDLPLRKLFEAPTVARLAEAAKAARAEAGARAPLLIPLPGDLRAGDLPLSFAQQRLWLLDQIEPGSAAYNLASAVRLGGEISLDLLERIFAEIVRRHESLRTTFPSRAGRPVQRIAPELRPEIRVIDVAGEEEARERALEEVRRPFDLQRGPLLRLALLQFGERDALLVMTLHHIVADGWSWGVLLREIGVLYQAFSEGRPSPLPELAVQYADFAVWQRSWLEGEVLERQLAWWRDQLAGAPAVLELPTDRPRPALPTHRGGVRPVALSPDLLERVTALCRRHGATPFMALLAAWGVLLGRHAGQDDVLIGTPLAGRNRRELEDLIGFFVNTLVLRVRLSGSFAALLERVRETALDAFAHQDVPFERLVDEVAPDRDLRRPPVFQVLFILQNAPLGDLDLPGLSLRQVHVDPGAAKFDLTLSLSQSGGFLEHDADLFDSTTAERLVLHYERLLRAVVEEPELPLADLPLMLEAERHQVLAEHNDAAAAYPADRCVHELIAEQAARTPEVPAIGRITYRELDRRAERLAWRLAARGVGPDVLVGLCAERSAGLVVGLLAVLKAGGAYVPLDPTHPRERLAYIFEDSGARVLLTERALVAGSPLVGAEVVLLDEEGEESPVPLPPADPENLAYVIYTSGSTGRPKGVEVRHRGVVNYLASMAACPGLGAGDVMMAVTTLSFDIAVTELLLPLTVGARVEIASRETAADALLLAAALETAGATCMQATPATWTLLLEGGWAGRPGLEALCGGEALPRALADRLLPKVGELWNVYGPTETTVWSAVLRVGPGERQVPVGLPLANTTLHLLDRDGGLAPLGVAGELLIGGDGLARGYHGRPDLTAERFVPDPFGPPGSRLYRTGDLARRLPDGTLEFLGRVDFQVKVRGFRIELGEIEAALASHPAVRECVVVARQDGPGDRMLVGYVVPHGEAAPAMPADVRAWLAGKLPPYMVPAAFVTLQALPLSPNGKVDRKALPAPSREPAERGYEAPRTPAEIALAHAWEQVLGVPRAGLHDNFFELGGDSILAVQVVFRAREAGLALEARDLFRFATLGETAAAVSPAAEPAAEEPAEEPAEEGFPEARLSRKDMDKLMARIGGKRGSAARSGRGT